MWDKADDQFDYLDDLGMLEFASITLEPEMEVMVFTNDGAGGQGDDDFGYRKICIFVL